MLALASTKIPRLLPQRVAGIGPTTICGVIGAAVGYRKHVAPVSDALQQVRQIGQL